LVSSVVIFPGRIFHGVDILMRRRLCGWRVDEWLCTVLSVGDIGESGCLASHHCTGGAVCKRRRCVCPVGYVQTSSATKCARRGGILAAVTSGPGWQRERPLSPSRQKIWGCWKLVGNRPVERVGYGVSYPGPHDVWGAPSARNIKYAKMYHFEKKNSQNFPQRGLAKMFGGPARMFPRASLWLSTVLVGKLSSRWKIWIHKYAIWK